MFLTNQKVNTQFNFWAVKNFENWDYTNPIRVGIGGSETSQIEMASRLAQRGHKVISYAPTPWDGEKEHRRVTWINYQNLDPTLPGIWVIYRYPAVLDEFKHKDPNQQIWLMQQDVAYNDWTEERADVVDKVLCLCVDHANFTAHKFPYLKDKIVITSNGISVDLIKHIEQNEVITRDKNKLIWPSSPDRGLDTCIEVIKRARFFIPELHLHVFYGFDNIDKLDNKTHGGFKHKMELIKKMVMNKESESIFWHGRIGQIQLIKEWLSTNIWCYPTNFVETSCISLMESQALGVIPITNPRWGLKDNMIHGVHIDGDAQDDALVRAKFVGEVIRAYKQLDYWESIRSKMMIDARVAFNWERFVDQWEGMVLRPDCPFYQNQFAFQQKYAYGSILNIGCDADPSGFVHRGAINMDVRLDNPITGAINPVNVICDIRKPADNVINEYSNKFDTVILGDTIEHMSHKDGVKSLQNASLFIKNGGILIVTCPIDERSEDLQDLHGGNPPNTRTLQYTDGVSVYHRHISTEELEEMLDEANLNIVHHETIDFTYFYTNGVIAQCR